MELSSPEGLEHVVRRYVTAAQQHDDPMLTHMMSTSPPSSGQRSELRATFDSQESMLDREAAAMPGEAGRQAIMRRRSSASSAVLGEEASQGRAKVVHFEATPTGGARGSAFERVDVGELKAQQSSLSLQLTPNAAKAGGAGGIRGGTLPVTIYGNPVPGKPIELQVPKKASMAQVIELVLKAYMKRDNCELLQLDGVDFELLMVRRSRGAAGGDGGAAWGGRSGGEGEGRGPARC